MRSKRKPKTSARKVTRTKGAVAPTKRGPKGRKSLRHSGQLRDREYEWQIKHPEVFEPLRGQWVVQEGEEIIAHGTDGASVVAEARSKGIRIPYVFYVHPRLEPDTMLIGSNLTRI